MYEENVKRGMAFCMATDPEWLDSIDVKTLDISDGCKCVVGQRYGCYPIGICNLLGEKPSAGMINTPRVNHWAILHGFDLPLDARYTKAGRDLTATWRRLILEAREHRKLSLVSQPLEAETERVLQTAN